MCYRTLQFPGSQVNVLCVTPDKQYLAACGHTHVRLYDINSNSVNPVTTYDSHKNNVTAVGFHQDGKWMFTGSEDSTIKVHTRGNSTLFFLYLVCRSSCT